MEQSVLVIDDQPEPHKAMSAIGAVLGVGVVSLRSGAEGLGVLERDVSSKHDSIALVLLDLCLEDDPGMEVLLKIRSDDRLRNMPVVLLTRSRVEADLWMAYKLQANAYLVKPASYAELYELLSAIVKFWCGMNVRSARALRYRREQEVAALAAFTRNRLWV